jgi:hypothetical protein
VRKLALAAILCALPLAAAQAQSGADYSNAPALAGSWSYAAIPGGSQARFMDSSGSVRAAIACSRAARQVSIARTSAAPAASLSVWTSTVTRNVPALFEQQAVRVVSQLNAYDTLLDAIAFSRGRFAVAMPGAPAIVLPSAPETARVIEDCRA